MTMVARRFDSAASHVGLETPGFGVSNTRWPMRVQLISSPSTWSYSDAANLLQRGIELRTYSTGLGALLGIAYDEPSAILAPTDLPGVGLIEFVEAVSAWTDIPVLIGIGREPEASELAYAAIDRGARSFITLPFTIDEFLVALRNMGLSASRGDSARTVTTSGLSLDPLAFRVTVHNKLVPLPASEFQILYSLVAEAPRVVSVEELLEISGRIRPTSINGVRTAIARIRRKVEAVSSGGSACISTVPGIGYQIVDLD